MSRIACIVGTRPEAIKMAPVVIALRETLGPGAVVLLATGQHRELLDETLAVFGLTPDIDLGAMRPGQELGGLTARLIEGLDEQFRSLVPAVVVAQGDTTSVLAAAIAAFYRRIPFAHVEAGLRTGCMDRPFPEEMNRVVTGRLARWHFAPTEAARRALLSEGVPPEAVSVTGNTVIDALLSTVRECRPSGRSSASEQPRKILLTAHRRENFGPPLENVFAALLDLLDLYSDVEVLYPVHPNPNVKLRAYEMLGGHPRVRLVAPLNYRDFVNALDQSTIVLTDSGGVQEEAPALGKPVVVLREDTERPEAIEAGVARLVGTDRTTIVSVVRELLDNPIAYAAMARGASPYGDGRASGRIAKVLAQYVCSIRA
jgi:UDP-N-acetylglucosamine 2-epimerase (non-hydrolysing)